MSAKRASIYTLGCRLNQAESTIMAGRLEQAGYELAPFDDKIDLGIVHTCTVTAEADAKSRKMLRGFIRRNPDAFTVAAGCYAELNPDVLAGIDGVDLIIGNSEKLELVRYIEPRKRDAPRVVREPPATGSFAIGANAAGSRLTQRVNLKIQDGCDYRCAYCVVPAARGNQRSRILADLLEDARTLAARGAKEIVLTGVHVGEYNYEGAGLVDVVDALNRLDGLERIRISSIDVLCVSDQLLQRMAVPVNKLVPFLHIPVQSGSDRVLRAMGRPYSVDDFRAVVERACSTVPDVCIGTDLLAGFPGETEADLEKTCALLADTPLTYAHVFKFSERPGTAAAGLPDKVVPDELNPRAAQLRRLSDLKRRRFNERHVGQVRDVLFEQRLDGKWYGYTDNYIRVAAPSVRSLANEVHPIVLDESTGNHMQGRLYDE